MIAQFKTAEFIALASKALSLNLRDQRKESYLAILDACEAEGVTELSHIAYILATARHESGMLPIREVKGKANSEVWLKYQSRYWNTGFYGRGFVQLTHERNYKKYSEVVGVDLVKNPDAALQMPIAAKILVHGMVHGWFTRRWLSFMLPSEPTPKQWFEARKIVNGLFHADIIARYASVLYVAMKNSTKHIS